MLSDQNIFQRYLQKRSEFNKSAEISLIGHSLFDMWAEQLQGTLTLKGKTVANLGISGVSTRQYLDVIVNQSGIQHLGQHVFLFLGVNDICKEKDYSPAQVMAWLNEILTILQKIAPHSRYYLLEATPVNNIGTVCNAQIHELNHYLKSHCPENVIYVPTQAEFRDENGDLHLNYCTDGLHFNQKGYQILQRILEQHL
ncbi:TPA: acylneuraminate cytidylyltransferase [Pasteurella multocida]|nr:acylneuraminate cytidylyltransferase [Pasteurella multocida]